MSRFGEDFLAHGIPDLLYYHGIDVGDAAEDVSYIPDGGRPKPISAWQVSRSSQENLYTDGLVDVERAAYFIPYADVREPAKKRDLLRIGDEEFVVESVRRIIPKVGAVVECRSRGRITTHAREHLIDYST